MDIAAMMQAAQKLQETMARVQEELAKKTVEAQSGGGIVTVTATGAREIQRIRIDPAAVDPKDLGMLEDLIAAACNAALRKAAELAQSEMAQVTAGLPIPPGLF
jgi:DNA-binding YbaB/EbfC family protein